VLHAVAHLLHEDVPFCVISKDEVHAGAEKNTKKDCVLQHNLCASGCDFSFDAKDLNRVSMETTGKHFNSTQSETTSGPHLLGLLGPLPDRDRLPYRWM
jgi:hypothetical protein